MWYLIFLRHAKSNWDSPVSDRNRPLSSSSDSQVKVYESKGGYYASMRYSGYTNEAKEKNYTTQLKTSLEKEGIQIAGQPKVFVYNSPFNFVNRRNEISFPIVWNE